METGNVLYDLTGVSKIYRKGHREIPAVKDLDLQIREGEWFAIQGKTGHGKTTLLQLLGGLDRPSRGSVVFAGPTWPPPGTAECARCAPARSGSSSSRSI